LRLNAIAVAALTIVTSTLAVTAWSRSGSAALRLPVPWARLAVSRPGGVYVVGNGHVRQVAARAVEPSWSPDGRRLAYVAPGKEGSGDVFVADANGTHTGWITRTGDVDETSPDWSPDGRQLVFEQAGQVMVTRSDGSQPRVLARGEEPAWSPGGRRIVFQRDGDLFLVRSAGGRPRPLVVTRSWEGEPAWSPDSRRVVYSSDETGASDIRVVEVRTRIPSVLTQDEFADVAPVFNANGRRVLFVSDRLGPEALWTVPAAGGIAVPAGGLASSEDVDARPLPGVMELLPDLDQQAPSDLDVRPSDRGFRLWFTSAADNVGLGPFIVNGIRRRGTKAMRANQRVRLTDRSLRSYPKVGIWRYAASPDHSHWHFMYYQRYELRRLNGSVLVRDRKSGFCLGDRYGVAPGKIEGRITQPVYRGFCNRYQPASFRVDGGTSVGYSDRYHSHLDGQNLDVTRVPGGEYLLVNRVNTQMLIRELRYENNAASLRIRLAWPHGRSKPPSVRVLRTCPDSDRC
jgi:dipeptidyl aminopeptidase/acylaminoacyl peptidase